MKTIEKQSDKLRRELTLFVDKMQLAGIDIVTIKKPISARDANRPTKKYVNTL
ncbi:hypothetical protein [Sporosarcina newyorkensis]|uniref:hypothetical protein n=1 Tax=Sporosarcina newyorkensis TaxID=759851 RepID=UPI003CFEED0D